ncbi:MAG: 2-dehydropantoate 2-reductase [Candidatus Sumerlaeaceae bacterium]|nr:2-dehydropantoate 2-reductase [Candidatus Sumerlaeaceae bacterium]
MIQAFQGKIGIIGAGALGAFYGARLFRAGHDVYFLMRRDYEAVRERGLVVRSVDGDFEIKPPVYPSVEALGVCDLVIIGLKSTDNGALPSLLGPTMGPGTLVLTMQNGLGNEEAVVQALGCAEGASQRVLGGIAFLCSNRISPGVIDHTAHGWVHLAELVGPAQSRTHSIAQLFKDAGIECQVFDSLKEIRWGKLVWNIPFNGLGVAGGAAHTAAILADETLDRTARGLMEEVLAAARADGVSLPTDLIDRMMESTRSMGNYRTSMQVDYEEGRRLEVEAILGEPYRRAKAAGIAVPRLEMLYGIVRRLDTLTGAKLPPK